ncbi:MAG: response regulator [Actinomycetota bacterium]|nr:response regulator [Actinomycetota bacterium]
MSRVLVVDDNPDIRLLVSTILEDEGYQVQVAIDGRDALRILETENPDVIVLDVMMPEMDGYSVLRQLRATGRAAKSRVLMLTAKNNEADWLRGYQSGANQYLTKPFDPDELIAAVEKLLRMDPSALTNHRQEELDRAQLLSRLESLLG